MSIQKIIQESINNKPLEMKEAFAEELRNRVAEALAAKIDNMEESTGENLSESKDKFHDVLQSHGYIGIPPGKHETPYFNAKTKTKALHKGNAVVTKDTHDGNKTHRTPASLHKYLNGLHDTNISYTKEEVELDEGLDFQNKTSSNGATTTHIFHNGKHVGTIAKHFTKSNPSGSYRIQYNSDTIPAGSKGLHAHEGLPSQDAAKKLVSKHFNIKEAEQIDEISVELAKRVKDKSNARGDAFRNKAGIVSATKDYSMQQARKNWNRADKAANYIKKKQEK